MGIFDNLAAPINQASLPPQFGGSTQAMDAGKLNYMAMLQPFLNAIQGGGSNAPMVVNTAPSSIPLVAATAPAAGSVGAATPVQDASKGYAGDMTMLNQPAGGYVDRMKPLLTEAPQAAVGGWGSNRPQLSDSVFRR